MKLWIESDPGDARRRPWVRWVIVAAVIVGVLIGAEVVAVAAVFDLIATVDRMRTR